MIDKNGDDVRYLNSEKDTLSDSVFETFLVMDNGRVFMLDAHLERMKNSVKELDLGPLPNTEELSQSINKIAQKEESRNRVLRVQYSPAKSISERCTYTMREPTQVDAESGIKIIVSDVRRNPQSYVVYHKTNNYLENRIALKYAIKKGYDDALFLNTSGDLAETTKANIFWVKAGKLYTPAIECGILPGIVRAWTIRHAVKNNIPTLQLNIDPEDLAQAEEVFVTNSVIGICRVRQVDLNDQPLFISPTYTPVTQLLSEAYRDESQIEDIGALL